LPILPGDAAVPLRIMRELRRDGPNIFAITADYRAGTIREDRGV
jgi:hypothetical protein